MYVWYWLISNHKKGKQHRWIISWYVQCLFAKSYMMSSSRSGLSTFCPVGISLHICPCVVKAQACHQSMLATLAAMKRATTLVNYFYNLSLYHCNSLYPRFNEVESGVYWFHPVHLSVRPSVNRIVSALYRNNTCWIHFIFTHLIKQLVCRV